jgi:hypothetical protein
VKKRTVKKVRLQKVAKVPKSHQMPSLTIRPPMLKLPQQKPQLPQLRPIN